MGRKHTAFLKDPKRPRSYLNSYVLFFLDIRPTLLETYPSMKFAKVGKAAGQLWRSMPRTQKEKYLRRAEMGRRRYQRRMTFYRQPSQQELFETYGMRPKRFLNPYACYVKRNFTKVSRRNPSFTFVQVSRELARSWNKLPRERKAPYVRRFLEDWRRWRREMHLYRGGHFRHNAAGCCHCCQATAVEVFGGDDEQLPSQVSRNWRGARGPGPGADCAVCAEMHSPQPPADGGSGKESARAALKMHGDDGP